jgi:hypothetical protein
MRLADRALHIPEIAFALLGLFCSCQQAPQAGIATGTPGVGEGDIGRLVKDLSIIAADSMDGRAAGSAGAIRAQRYIETELRAIGLVPTGANGSYEQPLRTVRRRVGSSTLTERQTELTVWKDFIPLPWPWATRPFIRGQAIYGGTIGDSIATDVAGKFVILKQPGSRSVIPRIGPGDPLSKAAAVAVVGFENFSPQRLAPLRAGLSAGLEGNAMMRADVPASILITTAAAERLLGRSLEQLRPGYRGRVVNASIVFRDSIETICCNVIAKLPGSDPVLRGEYVALSAHLDHIGVAPTGVDHDSLRAVNAKLWDLGRGVAAVDAPPGATDGIRVNVDSIHRLHGVRRDSIFNGADDDGSGTVALLEIARELSVGQRPRRSILFVWHTAEELGNQGSTWFTDHPTVPLDSVVALLHLDMVGRGKADDLIEGGPHHLEVIGSRRLSRQLGDAITQVNASRRQPFALDYTHDSQSDPMHLYCRSDHYEYARYGVPIAFFTTGEHPDYHQVTDETEYIDFAKLARVVDLVQSVAIRVANQGGRPALDSAKPDPRRGCAG